MPSLSKLWPNYTCPSKLYFNELSIHFDYPLNSSLCKILYLIIARYSRLMLKSLYLFISFLIPLFRLLNFLFSFQLFSMWEPFSEHFSWGKKKKGNMSESFVLQPGYSKAPFTFVAWKNCRIRLATYWITTFKTT